MNIHKQTKKLCKSNTSIFLEAVEKRLIVPGSMQLGLYFAQLHLFTGTANRFLVPYDLGLLAR